jgi:hypothetical protein
LRRQDITFEDKDQALRDDVRTLGRLVGELLTKMRGFARSAVGKAMRNPVRNSPIS